MRVGGGGATDANADGTVTSTRLIAYTNQAHESRPYVQGPYGWYPPGGFDLADNTQNTVVLTMVIKAGFKCDRGYKGKPKKEFSTCLGSNIIKMNFVNHDY